MTEDVLSPKLGKQFPIHDLMSEIVDPVNVYESFDYVVSHLENAQQREHIRPKRDTYCKELIRQLGSGEFRILKQHFREIVVKDGPKIRVCQCPTVFHRIGCHAVMVPFEKYTYPTLIRNTGASIKGRGMHWLHQIIEEDIQADPEGMKFYYQSDILHFYDNIKQRILMRQVREYTDDARLLPIMDNFISLLPESAGISKGLRASQCLANLHLSAIDHKMCEKVRYHTVKIDDEDATVISGQGRVVIDGKEIRFHYYRYCDDIVICAGTKKELWKLRDYLVSLLAELGLQIKPNEAVRPMREGLNYLGYVTFLIESDETDSKADGLNNYSKIRKRTKQKFCRRITRVKSRKRRQVLIGSFFGMAAHADCRHLLKKMITQQEFRKLKHKRKMKDIGDFKFTTPTLDGKKNFSGNKILPRDLNGIGFIVADFERGVVAKRDKDDYNRRLQDASLRNVPADLVPKPKDKYILQIIHHPDLLEIWRDLSVMQGTYEERKANRERVLARLSQILDQLKSRGELSKMLHKMWSGDRELWHYVDNMEANDAVPFFTALEMDYSGQYPKPKLVPSINYHMRPPTDEEEDLIFKTLNLR